MIDLKQIELSEWESRNFPRDRYEAMSKDQLIDIVMLLQAVIGIAEEVGEISHAILKGVQGIRDGVGGIKKDEVGDGVGDMLVFGMQTLSKLGMNAEEEIDKTIKTVLKREWTVNPSKG